MSPLLPYFLPVNYPNLQRHPDLLAARVAANKLLLALSSVQPDAPLPHLLSDLLRYWIYTAEDLPQHLAQIRAVHEQLAAAGRLHQIGPLRAASAARVLERAADSLRCTLYTTLLDVWEALRAATPPELAGPPCSWITVYRVFPLALAKAGPPPVAMGPAPRALYDNLIASPQLATALDALDENRLRLELSYLVEIDRDRLHAELDREFACALASAEQASDGAGRAATPADQADSTAYKLASELIDLDDPHCCSLKAINKTLDDNPLIHWRRPLSKRTGKPIPNRKEIHLGHWHDFKRQGKLAGDPLDLPSEIVDAAIAAAGRQDEIRKLKTERGK